MGDRANIKFIEEKGGLMYFYTHWCGFDYMKNALKKALALKERWDDDQYLARIIFCKVVKAAPDKTTGFGLSTQLIDNDESNPIIEVDTKSQVVRIGETEQSFETFIQ